MEKKGKILAIITARGGSKSIPRKNIKLFNGKPLINYTIKEALNSEYIDRVIVSTDDEEIAKIARENGAETPFMQPKQLAKDNSSVLSVVLYALNYLENKENYYADIIVMLPPTTPLRTKEHIDKAIKIMIDDKEVDGVMGVKRIDQHPYMMFKQNKNGLMVPIIKMEDRPLRRQDFPEFYVTNASIYVTRREYFKIARDPKPVSPLFGGKMKAIIMDEESSIDINNQFDFLLGETILKTKNNSNNNEKRVKIGNKIIGKGHSIFIIAEAGLNSAGDFDTAYKMIKVAKDIGADAVTFQNIIAKELNSKDVKSKITSEDWKKWEFTDSQLKELCGYAKELGLLYSICVTDNKSLDKIIEYGSTFIKIMSGDLTNTPFLKYCAKTKLPILLSTGGSVLKEIKEAISTIEEEGNYNTVIYHTNSGYPTPPKEVNLKILDTLKKEVNCPIGFCDHTDRIEIPIIAIARGAVVIEKHFTLDKNKKGPDFEVSLEPDEFVEMVRKIRFAEEVLGSPERKVLDFEKETIKQARRSIVSKVKIPKGTLITEKHISFKRPGTGISPKDINLVVGKKAKIDIDENIVIIKDYLNN